MQALNHHTSTTPQTATKAVSDSSRNDPITNEICHLVSEIQALLAMLDEDSGLVRPADWPPRKALTNTSQQTNM
jgi:hypothetical protein